MNESRPQLFGMLAGLFLAAGLVASAMLGTSAWMKIRNSQFINVKGSVQKSIESDLAIWTGAFQVEAETLLDAQHKVQANRLLVDKFLREAGLTNVTFAPINIEEMRAAKKMPDGYVNQIRIGYRLTQAVSVESTEVARIEKLDSTTLVEQGVVFTVGAPQFLYTKSAEAKIEMLADATKDARARAEQIAGQGGRTIARLESADQGVFQITPLHEVRTSWGGESDTTSRQKTITAVVTVTFLLK